MKRIIIIAICAIVTVTALIFFNLVNKKECYIESIHINSSVIRLESDMSKRLSVTVYPDESNKISYKLVSENEFVAVCDGDSISAVNEGETFVYATSLDGKIQSNMVKVIVSNNIFETAAKIIMLADNEHYLNEKISEEVQENFNTMTTEEKENLQNVEIDSQKLSQITNTEVKTVPEVLNLPVDAENTKSEISQTPVTQEKQEQKTSSLDTDTEKNGNSTEEKQVENVTDDMVYVTKSGGRFHSNDCSYAKKATAVARSEAISEGKTPCKKCNP